MKVLKLWPFFLLKFPFRVRLSLVIVTFGCCLALFWLVFPSTHNGTSIVIPIIVAAWLFGFRGLFLCIGATALALTCSYSLMLQTLLWPRPFFLLALTGFFTGALVGLIVSSFRYTVDIIEDARHQRMHAEEQRAFALAQQLDAVHEQERLLLEIEQQRQINVLKDQLLANVSHELRTPLAGVYGYLELLQVAFERGDYSLQKDFLCKALEGCDELSGILSTMLDAMSVGTHPPVPKPEVLALAPLVHDTIARMSPQTLQDAAISVHISEQVLVWADGQFVRQILGNLLSNALKYAPHTPILIYAGWDGKEQTTREELAAPYVCVNVKDAGPGIPPTEMPLLFQKFVRLKRDLTGNVRGTGLGLYISRLLVEAMHGHIWAESSGQPGEGTCFCFTLQTLDLANNLSQSAPLRLRTVASNPPQSAGIWS